GLGDGFVPPRTYKCLNTNYEPGLFIDDDEFYLATDASVRWVRETDTLGPYVDTWWTTRFGTYFQLPGNRVYFYCPTLDGNPWLTATLSGSALVFDNLGSYSNNCTRQQ